MANQTDKIQRSILPIPDRPHTGLTTYDAKDPDTKFSPIEPLRPSKGAPNVLVILLDDVGFATSSAFSGPCHAPQILIGRAFHLFFGPDTFSLEPICFGFDSRAVRGRSGLLVVHP